MNTSLTSQRNQGIWDDLALWWSLSTQPTGAVVWAVVQWWSSVGWERGCRQICQNTLAVDGQIQSLLKTFPAPEPSDTRRQRMLERLSTELSALPADLRADQTVWQHWWQQQPAAQATSAWTSILSPAYPPRLKSIEDPPPIVWWYGSQPTAETWSHPALAVVGSRRATPYGRQATQFFVSDLVKRFACSIISGGAQGIDTYAHDSALRAQGTTVVVLPSGVRALSARLEYWLDQHMPSGNVIALSEFPPDWPVRDWQFAQRNRLIAGLAQGTLVVEARPKSGTFLTAAATRAQGKDLFVVSAPFTSPNAAGVSHLVREGATLVTEPGIVARDLGWYHTSFERDDVSARKQNQKAPRSVGAPIGMARSPLQQAIITQLWQSGGQLPELTLQAQLRESNALEWSSQQWQTALLDLELREAVQVDRGLILLSDMIQS